jgi:hypothetical protein
VKQIVARAAAFAAQRLSSSAGSGSILGPQLGGRTQDSSRHADVPVLIWVSEPIGDLHKEAE